MELTLKDIITLGISGYGAFVATLVLVWNIYLSKSDKGKIKIGGFFGYSLDSNNRKEQILYYEFVNYGKKPITMEDGERMFLFFLPKMTEFEVR